MKTLFFLFILGYACGYFYFIYLVDIMRVDTRTADRFEHKSDAIVVLTGGSGRVQKGFELYNEKIAKYLFISGINADVTPATIMRSLNINVGLKELRCCVKFGQTAQDTQGNALEAKAWLDSLDNQARRVLLVTSDYHMPRSLVFFRNTLKGVEIIPYSVKSSLGNDDFGKFASITFTEYNKTLVSWVKVTFAQSP